MKRFALLLIGAALALSIAGCGLPGTGGASGYHVTAFFHEAIALYPHSRVKLMGVNAGTVDKVTVEGSQVRVDMTINHDVPLSPDVTATINALTIIGERNVVLGPPWHPGQDKVGDGFTIPAEHTTTPVETDDALKAFRDLAEAIDPTAVSSLVTAGANAFSGHESQFNGFVASISDLTADLGAQDDRIVKTAENLHTLAATAASRDDELGHVIDSFAQASGLLSSERDQISSLLSSSVRLVDAGSSLVSTYQDEIPSDLASLNHLGATLEANEAVFRDLFASFPKVTQGLLNAYDPNNNLLRLGANLSPSVDGLIDGSLGRILDRLGLGALTPCLAIPSGCQ